MNSHLRLVRNTELEATVENRSNKIAVTISSSAPTEKVQDISSRRALVAGVLVVTFCWVAFLGWLLAKLLPSR